MDIEDLLGMRSKEFSSFVREHLGDESDEVWDKLLDDQLVMATKDVLTDINVDLETQLGMRRSALEEFHDESLRLPDGRALYFEMKREYESWKKRILGFKRILRKRMHEANRAIQDMHQRASHRPFALPGQPSQPNPVKMKHNVSSLFELAYAVYRHREMCFEAGIVAEQHDQELWQLLETGTAYTAQYGAIPLEDWLERAMAKPNFVPPHLRSAEHEDQPGS